MLKASRNFLPRNAVTGRLSFEQANNVKEASPLHFFPSRVGFSTSIQNLVTDGRTYADFTIFKAKAALIVSPVLPKFSKIDSVSTKMDKNGSIMLKFMPAIGIRKYDWQKRQMFALSPVEVGCLISLDPQESCEFFHDPSMQSSLEGQVKKTLTVSPTPKINGYFVNMNVTNNNLKTTERFSLTLSNAEFAVLRTSFSFILPYIMGWAHLVEPQLARIGLNPSKHAEMRPNPDLEWDK